MRETYANVVAKDAVVDKNKDPFLPFVIVIASFSMTSSFKTLFWVMFGYGTREDADVIINNCDDDFTLSGKDIID